MHKLLKPGDWLVVVMATVGALLLINTFWLNNAAAKTALIRSEGRPPQEISLTRDGAYTVAGPLGDSVIEVRERRVRVARDPSPKQYCVHQGWLSRAGEIALCLPNRISVQLTGGVRLYDSLNF